MASRRGVGPLQSEHHRTFEARQAHATHAFLSPAPPPLLTTSRTTDPLRAALLSSWSGTLPRPLPNSPLHPRSRARSRTLVATRLARPCCASSSAMSACVERRLFVYAQRWCVHRRRDRARADISQHRTGASCASLAVRGYEAEHLEPCAPQAACTAADHNGIARRMEASHMTPSQPKPFVRLSHLPLALLIRASVGICGLLYVRCQGSRRLLFA